MGQASSPAGASGPSPSRLISQYVLVALAALLVFAGTLANGFVYDDVQLVLENPWPRSLAGVRDSFSQPLFGFLESSTAQDPQHHYYRPLMHVLLFGLRQAFGLQPWAHHLALMVMHAAVSVLVLWLLRGCLVADRAEPTLGAGGWAAFGGALLFALHPVHTEAVAWVSGAMDVGMALAVLLAARLWLPVPASPQRALGAGALWLAGLLLKETAIVLPVLLWALERATAPSGARGSLVAQARRYALLGLGLAAYLGLRFMALGGSLPTNSASTRVSRLTGVLAFPADLGGKLVWPSPLAVLSPRGPATSLADVRVWLGALCFAGILAGAVWAWRRGHRVVQAAGLWLLVPLLPALALQVRGVDAYAERYLYLSSVGFVLLVAVALRAGLSRWPEQARILALASGGVLAAFTLLTLSYVPVWRDNLTLWTYVQETVVDHPLIHSNLGDLHLKAGRLDAAISHLEVAAQALPGAFRVHNNLAVAYAKVGRLGDARKELERTVRLMPDNPVAWHNLGLVSRREGDLETAIARFHDALRLAPKRVDSLLELGRTLMRAGRASEAIPPLEEALRLEPGLTGARKSLAEARAAASGPPR
ncbi:tetratricopeptide repeat protein [Corallococcus exercitus]|uniref:Tetratricopeptide repeat protein n=1 Tax=Corallococcus exercitus TaxID=2316736 RepID=A0A7Y4NQ21_9BACT|nr:tetratricopeptide repeat protein [Corallococcus exercitus]NOK33140.1 tetratricopeptide repeat protein [Corallococcus exercitus]